MTRNNNRKKPARAYKAANPGVTYPEARRRTAPGAGSPPATLPGSAGPYPRPLSLYEVLVRAVTGDLQALDHELEFSRDTGYSAFYVDLGPEIEEGPVDVDSVDIDPSTMDYDESEQYEDGTSVGEVRVFASIIWSAAVYKPTYYGARNVQWTVIDPNWSDHYVLVSGELEVELTYEYTVVPGEEAPDAFTLIGLSKRA